MADTKTRRPRSPTPSEIADKVRRFEDTYTDVHDRMDHDYDLWSNKPYVPVENRDKGYRTYTSNDPVTAGMKATALLSTAKPTYRVPEGEKDREDRARHNDKERVAIGFAKKINENLVRQMQSPRQDQGAFDSTVRGYISTVNVIGKRKEGESFLHVEPWDPKRTSWGMGHDSLAWACHKIGRTKRYIKEEWGVTIDGDDATDDYELIQVFDYYDRFINKVVTKDIVIKKPTPHGATLNGRDWVPVTITPVGVTPERSITRDTSSTNLVDIGESIYKANRRINQDDNTIKSMLMELVGRSLKPVLVITSPDGSITLEEDPFKDGTILSFPEGTNIDVLGLHDAAQDTAGLLGIITAEKQRGTFPNTAFGELTFQLSGFAITTLGANIADAVRPMVNAMDVHEYQVLNNLLDMYSSGGFKPMELSGVDNNREWFSETITPESIRDLPALEVKFVAQLPKDDVSNAARAIQLKESRMFDHRTILEDVMQVQDPDRIMSRIATETAQFASPIAGMFGFAREAFEQDEEQLGNIYWRHAEVLVLQQENELLKVQMEAFRLQQVALGFIQGEGAQGQPQPQQGGILGPNGQPARMPPQVAPGPVQGIPSPPPTPQQGPILPPQSPRPGARNGPGPI
jgi:hypothetical protein